MPDWFDLFSEVGGTPLPQDYLRRKYLRKLNSLTKRNVIVYYSGWLQKRGLPGNCDLFISDADKTGFMTVVHKMDRSKGLDLILHTPGGDMAATESLIHYLRSMFGTDIRAFIPQMAMSGGTMIACACKEIVMGAQSCVGPFDPQINGNATQAILADVKRAIQEMKEGAEYAMFWQPIIQRYQFGFFEACEQANNMADQVVRDSLKKCMFENDPDADNTIENIVKDLGRNAQTKLHARHIHKDQAKAIGLKIVDLEDDNKLQDAVLSVHHACVLSFEQTGAFKIIENHMGRCHISVLPPPMPSFPMR